MKKETPVVAPGTTKRKRRSKAEIAKEKEAKALAIKEKAQIHKLVDDLEEEGATILRVHARRRRFHSQHHIVVMPGGEVFFPDHSMCGPHALVAEYDLLDRKNRFRVFEDACFAVAFFLVRPGVHEAVTIPLAPSSRAPTQKGMTNYQRTWMDLPAFEYLQGIVRMRQERKIRCRPLTSPWVVGTPLKQSVRRRLQPIKDKQDRLFREKLARVHTAYCQILGVDGEPYYTNFREEHPL